VKAKVPIVRKPRKGGRRSVADVLERVLKKNSLERGFGKAKVLAAWDDVVGKQLARTTRAVAIRDGVMIVRVQDNTAANFFTMQRHIYLERLKAALGDESPRDLRFEQGALEIAAREVKAKPVTLTRSEHAHIEELLTDAAPDIVDTARRAAEALARAKLSRAKQGFKPCPICGMLNPEEKPCQHCRVTLEQPLTKTWQSRLIRNPDLAFEAFEDVPDDVLLCARYRALEYLTGQLEALTLRILQATKARRRKAEDDPEELRPYLELTAKAWLALHLRVPMLEVTRRDWATLPATTRSLLEMS
jgi:predicted nucleic acid-binding Zn ribbon protein